MGLTYADLYTQQGLEFLHRSFMRRNPPHDLCERAIALQTFIEDIFGYVYHDDAVDQRMLQDVRRTFVQRYALVNFSNVTPHTPATTTSKISGTSVLEWAQSVYEGMHGESLNHLDEEARYAAWAAQQPDAHPLFHQPKKRVWHVDLPNKKRPCQQRYGFDLADPGLSRDQAYREAFYCIGCHTRDKDSCSHGLGGVNPLGLQRTGCPLRQKVSQMAVLAQSGNHLAAVAVAMIDNPLLAATGHRICTRCMDACIYQKQDPVNIPGLESFLLQGLYHKPFGFEVYRLLTLWNPLSAQPLPCSPTGRHVFVVGTGPAGMMVSHLLLRRGHTVYAIDGLHIRLLPRHLLQPKLLERLPPWGDPSWCRDGFGGVMTYGITARWDIRNLLVLRLLLERHERFFLKGDVRLGSTTTLERVRDAGFSHVALCMGAGPPQKPHAALLKGSCFMHTFLMSLHLHGQPGRVYYPCIIIGGGLTAVDGATEVLVWLRQQHGNDLPTDAVTLLYRRPVGQSPAWRFNAYEVRQAAAEGVNIVDNVTPLHTVLDDATQCVTGLCVEDASGHTWQMPARTVFLATGSETHNLAEHDLPSAHNLMPDQFVLTEGVSVLGDMHPYYRGSVVQAMASARNALEAIHDSVMNRALSPSQCHEHVALWWHGLDVVWLSPIRMGEQLWLLRVHAPEAAHHFRPGQFFRVTVSGRPPIALTGALIEGPIIHMLLHETPFSSPVIEALQRGQQLGFMGPTGMPTVLPHNKHVQVVGSGFGHGALLPIVSGLKSNGCVVTYLGHDDGTYANWRHRIEACVDACIWFDDELPHINSHMLTFVIAPLHFLKRLSHVRLRSSTACATSPMQCMMKGMCGRCITHKEGGTYVWACAEQDLPWPTEAHLYDSTVFSE